MHRFIRRGALPILLGLLCLPPAGQARPPATAHHANVTSQPGALQGRTLSRMLDPATPRTERERLFLQLKRLADGGNGQAQYLVGSLYHAGHDQPAALVRRNLQRAAVYLSHAALHGILDAMAKEAEIQYRLGHVQSARVWTQLYGHYLHAEQATPRRRHQLHYLASLLHEIGMPGGTAAQQAIVRDMNAFIARYDTSIRRAMTAHASHRPGWLTPPTPVRIPVMGQVVPHAGICDFLVRFSPAGTVRHVWLIDATPEFSTAVAMEGFIRHITVRREAGAGPRYAGFSMPIGSDRYRLQ